MSRKNRAGVPRGTNPSVSPPREGEYASQTETPVPPGTPAIYQALRDTNTDSNTLTGDPADIVVAADPDSVRDAVAGLLTLRLRGLRPDWHRDAACSGTDPEVFFPGVGGSTRQALEICAGCRVRRQCADEAIADPSLDFGVRGGMTAAARRLARRNRVSSC